MILAAKANLGDPLCHWTEDDVWRLWWLDLSHWCARHLVPVPPGMARALLTLLAHLDDTAAFDDASDLVEDLRAALHAAGGATAGLDARTPAG